MPFSTGVPFTQNSAPHLGAILHSVRSMHTENTRNRALRRCLLRRDLCVHGKDGLVVEYAGVLKVKRSCSNRHDRDGVDATRAGGTQRSSATCVTDPLSDSRWRRTHVDEIMCGVQGASKKAAIVGFGPLPVRMGVAECRSGSRKTYRVSRANKKVCLRVNAASRPE